LLGIFKLAFLEQNRKSCVFAEFHWKINEVNRNSAFT